jgi:hypothetical protein
MNPTEHAEEQEGMTSYKFKVVNPFTLLLMEGDPSLPKVAREERNPIMEIDASSFVRSFKCAEIPDSIEVYQIEDDYFVYVVGDVVVAERVKVYDITQNEFFEVGSKIAKGKAFLDQNPNILYK